MQTAKIISDDQIKLPLNIRKTLKLKDNENIAFFQNGNKIVLGSQSMIALLELQEAFDGVAEELGLKTEEDVVNLIKEVRAKK
ncbi:MAG: AbrB/MazE/SpoVT family DNA-binding domain-containing protein [Clostridiales bacterium]|jgi:bifunctional DNA-binding transcriptional regulator/antitoxin component of YhaV-PrlF toxin-antitoxin module|nr:AbrB/MazE/SpoVT family DNA-binding domain-containing protein [Clostridiales bacterium]